MCAWLERFVDGLWRRLGREVRVDLLRGRVGWGGELGRRSRREGRGEVEEQMERTAERRGWVEVGVGVVERSLGVDLLDDEEVERG